MTPTLAGREAQRMLLAGDVGGTTTRLGLFAAGSPRPASVRTRKFVTLEFTSLEVMIDEFLRDHDTPRPPLEAACFGVAGPVRGQTARLTNVPWQLDGTDVARRFAIGRVAILNDLEAMAYGATVLGPTELTVLQAGQALDTGNAALIAAGTGLGEALLHRVNGRLVPASSEGGHADFAARTPRELEFVRLFSRRAGRVRCEDVLSGQGLVNLHRFVHHEPCQAVGVGLDPGRLPAAISRAALQRHCAGCVDTLELFVSAYGAETGNLALRSTATAGVYVGGGIAPQILPALEAGGFMDAFRAKRPMRDLLAAMPVRVIRHAQPGLLGAATYANAMVERGRA